MACCRELDIKSSGELKELFIHMGVNPDGMNIMIPRGRFRTILLKNLKPVPANILKQECLAVGAECALHQQTVTHDVDTTDALLMATDDQCLRIINHLQRQPFGLSTIGKNLNSLIFEPVNATVKLAHGKTLDLAGGTVVMGILNLTPDSFSDGGKYTTTETALKRAEEMIREGAGIIDVGGESTRPGAAEVSVSEEMDRVVPVVEKLAEICPVISVDTAKPDVAEEALKAGAHMINDIFGFRKNHRMSQVVYRNGAGAVLMHIQGTPGTMQKNPQYGDVVGDILKVLEESVKIAEDEGITKDHLIIDPGIGFGKDLRHNLDVLLYLKEFLALKIPVLVGASRKSFIGKIDHSHVTDRLGGSLAAAVTSVMNGASILRVHDIKETVQAVKVIDEMKRNRI